VIAVPELETSLTQGFRRTHNDYARYLNKLRGRSGHLWQNRFYSAPMDRGHVLRALRYVDLNPVRARLAEQPREYRWTSVEAHLSGRDPSGLVDVELWKEVVGDLDWGRISERVRDLGQGLGGAISIGDEIGEAVGNRRVRSPTGVLSRRVARTTRPRTPKSRSAFKGSRRVRTTTIIEPVPVSQGQPCVTCGQTASTMYADHKVPVVKEYYETGTIDTTRMRQVDAVQPQCLTCSNRQGAELQRYSMEQRKRLEKRNEQ